MENSTLQNNQALSVLQISEMFALINIFSQHMTEFDLQNKFASSLLEFQNPLIKLYLVKKSIEQDLIREIQINSYLQKIFEDQQAQVCKIEHAASQYHQEISTCGKVPEAQQKSKKKHYIRKLKNDTKNIPKNFGKAIITFVEQREDVVRRFLSKEEVSYQKFYSALRDKKRGINSIADLRNLWLEQHFEYARLMRTISLYFLKRGSLSYVFSSRIANHEGHVKYRNRLIEVLRYPEDFTSIKTS